MAVVVTVRRSHEFFKLRYFICTKIICVKSPSPVMAVQPTKYFGLVVTSGVSCEASVSFWRVLVQQQLGNIKCCD